MICKLFCIFFLTFDYSKSLKKVKVRVYLSQITFLTLEKIHITPLAIPVPPFPPSSLWIRINYSHNTLITPLEQHLYSPALVDKIVSITACTSWPYDLCSSQLFTCALEILMEGAILWRPPWEFSWHHHTQLGFPSCSLP